jgi:hypothetical protein
VKWYVHEASGFSRNGSWLQIRSEVKGGKILFVVTCQRPMTDESRERYVRTGIGVRVVLTGVRATYEEAKALGNKWGRS